MIIADRLRREAETLPASSPGNAKLRDRLLQLASECEEAERLAAEALVEDLLTLKARYDNPLWKPAPIVLARLDELLSAVDPTGETIRAIAAKIDRMKVGLARLAAEHSE